MEYMWTAASTSEYLLQKLQINPTFVSNLREYKEWLQLFCNWFFSSSLWFYLNETSRELLSGAAAVWSCSREFILQRIDQYQSRQVTWFYCLNWTRVSRYLCFPHLVTIVFVLLILISKFGDYSSCWNKVTKVTWSYGDYIMNILQDNPK